MISILSPVFKDIVIDERSRFVSKNAIIFPHSKTEYGGVNKLQRNFRGQLGVSWFYIALDGKIALTENCKHVPDDASEITAIIYLKNCQKKTHILNLPPQIRNWSGPMQASKLLHVMYAEYFDSLSFTEIRKKFEILTTDFCSLDHVFTKKKLVEFVSIFDYVFCSEHDMWANSLKKLRDISQDAYELRGRRTVFIFHTPKYVRLCIAGKALLIKNRYFRASGLEKVVGNGDLFAFLLLKRIIKNSNLKNLVDCVETVQKDFLNYA